MNGSGCRACPVENCAAQYRGSLCAAMRARRGLGDPKTNSEEIRAMSDEDLAAQLIFFRDDWDDYETHVGHFDTWEEALKAEVEWLQRPAEEADDGD